VRKGVAAGRRPDLTGGGLVRSAGGWSALRAMRNDESRMKGDERILGQGDFVETGLKVHRRIWTESLKSVLWGTILTGWWMECSVYSDLLSTSY